MKKSVNFWSRVAFGGALVLAFILVNFGSGDAKHPGSNPLLPTAAAADAPKDTASGQLVPLTLKLPDAAFKGTPKDVPTNAFVEPLSDKPRPPMMVPAGLKNLAALPGVKISSSDKNAAPESLAKLTDGNKEGIDDAILYLRKGTQWVQLDLGAPHQVFAIVIWHAHDIAKIYRDVVVQVADDPEFTANVRTLFNNDRDNSSGLGAGTDLEYFETREGKLINAKGVTARCLRCYSRGSTESAMNQYTEIEVYGRPAQ
jgi:hypothetical protein